ncbi:MAG: hypothetical protein Q4A21_00125 [bacterium]|nr:hypothetical protein [bacterium]
MNKNLGWLLFIMLSVIALPFGIDAYENRTVCSNEIVKFQTTTSEDEFNTHDQSLGGKEKSRRTTITGSNGQDEVCRNSKTKKELSRKSKYKPTNEHIVITKYKYVAPPPPPTPVPAPQSYNYYGGGGGGGYRGYNYSTTRYNYSPRFSSPRVYSPPIRSGAFCRDGSMSSATGRGACSRHGGVSSWY